MCHNRGHSGLLVMLLSFLHPSLPIQIAMLRLPKSPELSDQMRVYLTQPELETEAGKELLQLCKEITKDGRIELQEINALRRWLCSHKGNTTVVAIAYLGEIMERITADRVINRDELSELHLAIERVIPAAVRMAAMQARRSRETKKKEIRQERKQLEKERGREERVRLREENRSRAMRIRHQFTKVAGVTFLNDNGTDRQHILSKCKAGEQLILKHDPLNEHSEFAIEVRRTTGEQLGFLPEWLTQEIRTNIEDGYRVLAVVKNITGKAYTESNLGANLIVLYIQTDVTDDEATAYANALFQGHS